MFYFIYGDKPLLLKYEELIEKIKKENSDIPTKIYDSLQNEEENFLLNITTNSMFAPKELIILKRTEKSKKLDIILKTILDYDLNKKEVVIVYEEILDDYDRETNKVGVKVLKLAEKLGKIIEAKKSKEKKSLQFYIEKELEISEYEAEKLLEILGDDFFKVKNEIEKIKNFLNEKTFILENVIPILTVSDEYNLINLVNEFMISDNTETVIKYLKKSKEYMLFLSILSEEIILALKIVELNKNEDIYTNMSYNNFKDVIYPKVKKYFKNRVGYTKEYPIFLKRSYSSIFKSEFLLEKIEEILEIEHLIKSGEIEESIGVEKYLLNFKNQK